MLGEVLRYRALIAFQRKSDTTALTCVVEKWNCGQGTLAMQASLEECRGHPKETSLSGNEVTWILLKLD